MATCELWNDARTMPPPTGKLVRVMYDDGLECNAERASGRIYYPEGSEMYRYVDVARWKMLPNKDDARAGA